MGKLTCGSELTGNDVADIADRINERGRERVEEQSD